MFSQLRFDGAYGYLLFFFMIIFYKIITINYYLKITYYYNIRIVIEMLKVLIQKRFRRGNYTIYFI